jgi:hypothetical protein
MIKQANLDRFAKTWLDLFRFPKLPIYLHILIEHYNEKVECVGGLKKISQENVESHHLYEKQVQLRQTNGGSGGKNVYESILTVEYRRIMSSNDYFYFDEECVVRCKK